MIGFAKFIFCSFCSISRQPRRIFSTWKRHQKVLKNTFQMVSQFFGLWKFLPWKLTKNCCFFSVNFSWINFWPIKLFQIWKTTKKAIKVAFSNIFIVYSIFYITSVRIKNMETNNIEVWGAWMKICCESKNRMALLASCVRIVNNHTALLVFIYFTKLNF